MADVSRRFFLILLLAGLVIAPAFSQDAPNQQAAGATPAFGMNLGIGVQSYNDLDPVTGKLVPTTYQSLGLTPDVGFGEFGVGLAVTINYRMTPDNQVEIRTADWIPTSFQNFLEIYLPKVQYVRWGQKGEPLYIKAGSFKDATLGNGFIMSDYANTLFLPTTRSFGLEFDLDGSLFSFPLVGLETIVGNLAVLDVVGGRLYLRPLIITDIPVLKDIEIGGTLVADTKPGFYAKTATTASTMMVYGADFRLPILANPVISLATFGDFASLAGKNLGGMLGLGGRLFSILPFGAQLRIIGPGFIPSYFGATYDLFRASQYDAVQAISSSGLTVVGWFATLGTSFLDDKIVFNVNLDAPFVKVDPKALPTDPSYILNYPHLRGIFTIAEGIVPGLSFDFSYDKKGIVTWADLISPANAAIQAQLNYKTGPAVISFIYMIRYAPEQQPNPWVVTSGLQSSIQLF